MSKSDAGVGNGLNGLDTLYEHRLRLGAGVLLSRMEALSFARLKELLQATDGNLGAQLRKLEDAGYIEARKDYQDRKPITWYSLTPPGRAALKTHLAAVEAIIRTADTG